MTAIIGAFVPRGRICFLTMDAVLDKYSDVHHDDRYASKQLELRGYQVDFVSWRSTNTDWGVYDLVVVRSTWDYHHDVENFIKKLREISRHTAVQNSPDVVRYNSSKRYLSDFSNSVPTTWFALPPSFEEINAVFNVFKTDRLVVKPQIGAGSECTHVITKGGISLKEWQCILEEYADRPETSRGMMAQPFRSNIQIEGEYSGMFFGEKLSHVIVKKPKSGEFRSQLNFGSRIVQETDPKILSQVTPALLEIHSKIPRDSKTGKCPLYARVDIVRNDEGSFEVMEIEMIEPLLFFEWEPKESPKLFADAVEQYILRKESNN